MLIPDNLADLFYFFRDPTHSQGKHLRRASKNPTAAIEFILKRLRLRLHLDAPPTANPNESLTHDLFPPHNGVLKP
jgi:hypothetical protein